MEEASPRVIQSGKSLINWEEKAQVRQEGKRTPDRGHCPLGPWLVSVGTWALSLQNHRTQRLHACPGMRPDNCGSLWSGHSTRSPMLAWHITHAKQGDSTDFTKQLILAKKKKRGGKREGGREKEREKIKKIEE